MKDPDSIFHYYQQLIKLRKRHDIIVYGTYDLILEDDPSVYAYTRTLGDEKLVVICNFTGEGTTFTLPDSIEHKTADVLIGNYDSSDTDTLSSVELKPYEARVYLLK